MRHRPITDHIRRALALVAAGLLAAWIGSVAAFSAQHGRSPHGPAELMDWIAGGVRPAVESLQRGVCR